MTIEVGDILRHNSGNEYTVEYVGKTHGVATLTKRSANSVAILGVEMSFHTSNISTAPTWTHVKAQPTILTAWFCVLSGHGGFTKGELEEVEDAADGWDYVLQYPETYLRFVIRVNPDQTWNYVDAEDNPL